MNKCKISDVVYKRCVATWPQAGKGPSKPNGLDKGTRPGVAQTAKPGQGQAHRWQEAPGHNRPQDNTQHEHSPRPMDPRHRRPSRCPQLARPEDPWSPYPNIDPAMCTKNQFTLILRGNWPDAGAEASPKVIAHRRAGGDGLPIHSQADPSHNRAGPNPKPPKVFNMQRGSPQPHPHLN